MNRPPGWLIVALATLALGGALALGVIGPEGFALIDKAAPGALPAPPTITLLDPVDGAGVRAGQLMIHGEALAEGRITDIQLRLDGGPWESLPDILRGAPAVPFRTNVTLTRGDHLLEVRAYDGAAFSLPARAYVRADTVAPPTLFVDAPRTGDGLATGVVTFRGRTTGLGPISVKIEVAGNTTAATVTMLGTDRSTWRADVQVPLGAERAVVTALGSRMGGLPVVLDLATASSAPPRVDVLLPQPNAAFGSSGDATCAPTCIRFAGTARGATHIMATLDGTPPISIPVMAEHWTWDVPMSRLYAGVHRVLFVPESTLTGAPVALAFNVRSPLRLDVDGDDAPRPTGMTLAFRVDAMWTDVTWMLDDQRIATGNAASLTLQTPGDHRLDIRAASADGRVATRTIPLFAVNRAPEVQLAVDTSTEGGVMFLADAFDPDGTIAHFRWEFGDGRTLVSTGSKVQHNFAREGLYRVNVTAFDDRGTGSAPAQALLPIQNAPPIAAFSWTPERPSTLDMVVFRDESVDPEGRSLVGRLWRALGAENDRAEWSHRFETRGEHAIMLEVQDEDGGIARETRVVTVINLPPTPRFDVTPSSPVPGELVRFNDTSVKLDGDIISWKWDLGDGLVQTSRNASREFTAAGVHFVTLTVTDDMGDTANVTVPVLVRPAAPSVLNLSWSPVVPKGGQEVRFDAIAYDLEGDLASLTWSFGDGASLACARTGCGTGGGASPWVAFHVYARSGLYEGNVTVTDDGGRVTIVPFLVDVKNAAPAAILRLVDGGAAAFPTRLAANATDPDGQLVRFIFDADDDGVPDCIGAMPTCTFVYEQPGSYRAVLTVEDDQGATATATTILDIRTPPGGLAPPRVVFETPAANTALRGELLVRGAVEGVREIVQVELQLRDGPKAYAPGDSLWAAANGTSAWRLLLQTRGVPDGAYELVARATDVSGAVGFARVNVLIHNDAAPGIALTVADLPAESIIDGSRLVRGSAYHVDGVTAVRWRVDERPWRNALGDPIAWAISLDGLAPGAHVLTVDAYRGIGERERVEVPFTVRGVRPVLTLEESPPALVYGLMQAAGRVDVPSHVLWRIDHGVWVPLGTGETWRLDEPTVGVRGGTHTLSFKAVALDGALESDVVTRPIQIIKLHQDPPPARPAAAVDEDARAVPFGPAAFIGILGASLIARRTRAGQK